MKKWRVKMALGALCCFLGFIIAVQLKSVQLATGGTMLSPKRAQQLTDELKGIQQEKERLAQELSRLEEELKQYEDAEVEENAYIGRLRKELQQYQVLVGQKTVEGPGVVITLELIPQEFEDGLEGRYEYLRILEIINQLNKYGAEAIAINDQRITIDSEFYYTGKVLYLNGSPLNFPIQIKAIGDADAMDSGLNISFGMATIIKEDNRMRITVKKQNQVVIPRLTKLSQFKYAKPIGQTQ